MDPGSALRRQTPFKPDGNVISVYHKRQAPPDGQTPSKLNGTVISPARSGNIPSQLVVRSVNAIVESYQGSTGLLENS